VPKTSYRPLNKVYKHKEQPARSFRADGAISKIPYRLAEQPEHS